MEFARNRRIPTADDSCSAPAGGIPFMADPERPRLSGPPEADASDSADELERLAALARRADAPDQAADALDLLDRAQSGGFHLACVGQFKRGKSTLINALLGEPVLPTGVLPVTSLPVQVRYGPRAARLRRAGDARWEEIPLDDLPQVVTETGNPGNTRQVATVEVRLPSPLLHEGICLLDTPGLGSVFTWNTAKTHEAAPTIDALLIVSGAEPPLTQEELELLRQFADVEIPRLLILNKADRSPPEAIGEAAHFSRQVLAERLGWSHTPTFVVSATEALQAGATRDWTALVDAIVRLARRSGHDLARAGIARGRARLHRGLQEVLRSRRAALVEPVAETERRAAALRDGSRRVERSLLRLEPMLRLEEQQIAALMARRRQEFLAGALPAALDELDRELHRIRPARRRAALEVALRIARARVLPWLETSEPVVAETYRGAMQRLAEEATSLVAEIYHAGALPGSGGPSTEPSGYDLKAVTRFYFLEYEHLVAPAGLDWLTGTFADAVVPRRVAARRIQRAARRLLRRLLEVNSTRVANDLAERVREDCRRLQRDIRDQLAGTLRAVEEGLARARALHAAGAQAVADELASLDGLLAELPEEG